jgi:hypothetical protein
MGLDAEKDDDHMHPETLDHIVDTKAEVIEEIQHYDSEINKLMPEVQRLRDEKYVYNATLLQRMQELETRMTSVKLVKLEKELEQEATADE